MHMPMLHFLAANIKIIKTIYVVSGLPRSTVDMSTNWSMDVSKSRGAVYCKYRTKLKLFKIT